MIKKMLLTICLLWIIPSIAFADVLVTLQWDANTHPDLAGYQLYQRYESNPYDFNTPINLTPISPTETTYQIALVVPGTYFWVIKAFDNLNRYSPPSNEVMATIDTLTWIQAPTGFIIIKIENIP